MRLTTVLLHRGGPINPVPFIRFPKQARVVPLGTPTNIEDKDVLLHFPDKQWVVKNGGDEGWAIVGDAEGRRLAIEVSGQLPNASTLRS